MYRRLALVLFSTLVGMSHAVELKVGASGASLRDRLTAVGGTVAVLNYCADGANLTLNSIGLKKTTQAITPGATTTSDRLFESLRITDSNGGLIRHQDTLNPVFDAGGYISYPILLADRPSIQAGSCASIHIGGNMGKPGLGFPPVKTGDSVTIDFDEVHPTNTSASGNSPNINTPREPTGRNIIVKAVPYVVNLPLPSNTITGTDQDIYRFSFTAVQGAIGLRRMTFAIEKSCSILSIENVNLEAYTDANFTTLAYATNPLNSAPMQLVSNRVVVVFSPRRLGEETVTIPVNPTATTTFGRVYFKLRAKFSGPQACEVRVYPVGDTKLSVGSLDAVKNSTQATSNMIWTDYADTITAGPQEQHLDWHNGYVVPTIATGLPIENIIPALYESGAVSDSISQKLSKDQMPGQEMGAILQLLGED